MSQGIPIEGSEEVVARSGRSRQLPGNNLSRVDEESLEPGTVLPNQLLALPGHVETAPRNDHVEVLPSTKVHAVRSRVRFDLAIGAHRRGDPVGREVHGDLVGRGCGTAHRRGRRRRARSPLSCLLWDLG